MKKQKLQKAIVMTGLITVMAGSLAGCGKDDSGKKETTAATTEATEATTEEATGADADEILEYKDAKGWSVSYKPSLIALNEFENGASFVYTGESAGSNLVTISYIEGKQPEEVLSEITEGWGEGIQEDIIRTENYLPGTDDKWSFWRMYQGNCLIAGEYNGGVILFEVNTHEGDSDEKAMTISDLLSEIISSIKYDNFEAQTLFDYVPGTYTSAGTEEIEGENTAYEHTITLNDDHTGKMVIQDEVNIIWSSNELISEDGSSAYEYTIEGNELLVNFDDEWVTFTK